MPVTQGYIRNDQVVIKSLDGRAPSVDLLINVDD